MGERGQDDGQVRSQLKRGHTEHTWASFTAVRVHLWLTGNPQSVIINVTTLQRSSPESATARSRTLKVPGFVYCQYKTWDTWEKINMCFRLYSNMNTWIRVHLLPYWSMLISKHNILSILSSVYIHMFWIILMNESSLCFVWCMKYVSLFCENLDLLPWRL